MENIDVYAYGMVSSSTLHLLCQPFPQPDGYAEITQTFAMTGGEALNSSIVLSRLDGGIRILLDGNWIGDTQEGRQLLRTIQSYPIDTRRLAVKEGYEGVREIVFSDDTSRTIFGNYVDLFATTPKWNIPRKADVERARIVCLDPFFGEESTLVGKYAIELGIPFVSLDCAFDHELATRAEAVIISGEFRQKEYPQVNILNLLAEYQRHAQGMVVFTVGGEKVLFSRKNGPVNDFQPYPVQVIDSAGAGDSFRAGIIYGLLQGWDDATIIRFASATAAMVCTRFPGVLDSPTKDEVFQFIQERGNGT